MNVQVSELGPEVALAAVAEVGGFEKMKLCGASGDILEACRLLLEFDGKERLA